MGPCTSAQAGKNKSRVTYSKAESANLQAANVDSSSVMGHRELAGKQMILRDGSPEDVNEMIKNSVEDINAYEFGGDKTLLHEAVILSNQPAVIELILKKGAKVDQVEIETGSTALFLAAVDLKVDFVNVILKYHPDINHVNNAGQDIFQFLNFQLFDQKKALKREMTKEENNQYTQILQKLTKYKEKKENEVQLDPNSKDHKWIKDERNVF